MKTVTCTNAKLEVVDQPTPKPAKGQLLIDVLRCGICGSDLHTRNHCDDVADVMAQAGYPDCARSHQSVVFGHEFCGEVLDHGSSTRKTPRAGTPVVAAPFVRRGKEVHLIGLSTKAPGGYAEHLVVEQSLALPVPNGLPIEHAALTEPMAVAWHAVRRSEITKKDVAIVIGCGPIGLAVILMLKAMGVRTVIASNHSPFRRTLAAASGADVVVNPAEDSPYAACPALSKTSSLVRRCRRASWWSVFVWAPTASGRQWRLRKRLTCASCSAIRRSSSATRSTCSPTARSTSPR
jgi:threonine dehydrogenase-like Zn-dependent dehydrogenase